VLDHGFGQHIDHLVAVDPAPHMDRQAFPRVLVNQVQEAHRPAVVREGAHEIVRPDVIRPLRPQPHAGAVVAPQARPRLLLLRHLQPFAAPDVRSTRSPAHFLQLDGDASISVPTVLAGERDDSPAQRVLVVPLGGLVALRAARWVNQSARMTFTRPLLPGIFHSGSAPLRA
jgi:hypothetical protein